MSEKLFVCDIDGTVIEEEVIDFNGDILPTRWNQIINSLGDDACQREKEAKQKWYEGGYDTHPANFLNDVIKIFYDFELKRDYFEEVIGNYVFFPGVEHVFGELHKRGYKTALISGGFKALADMVSKDLRIDYTCAACELIWDSDGNLVAWNLPRTDYGSKVGSLEKIREACGVDISDCIYVGNGYNDILVAKYVVDNGGTAFAFNGPSKLGKACTDSVVQRKGEENFYTVLERIDNYEILRNTPRYALSI